jgi:hypothetical protein
MLMTCSGRPGLRLRPAARRIAACIALGIGFVIGAFWAVPHAAAQVVDHRGTEFFLPFLPHDDPEGSVEVQLTSDVQTQVAIAYPAVDPSFTTTVDLAPGNATVVALPSAAAQGWQPGTPQNNAVRVFGDAPFAASIVNRGANTGDAALALPVDALGTQYYVLTYAPQSAAQFAVVASSDETTVTITPTTDLLGGFEVGVPFSLTLNRGDGFLGQSAGGTGAEGELSGTLIESSAPIAVTMGNVAAEVPPATGAGDLLMEFAPPIPAWGTEYVVAPLPQRPNGSAYRIIAAENNTTVEQNGTPVTLNAGQFTAAAVDAGPQVFRADKPIFGVQALTGNEAPGAVDGDPATANLIATDQFLPRHTFSTVGDEQFATNYATVVAATQDAAASAVTLNDSPIDASLFTPIDGTDFSYAVEPIPPGTFTTASPSPHGVTVSGFGDAEAYLYPAGVQFDLSEPVVDPSPPVCEGSLDGSTFFGSVRDNRDPDDTGVFAVELAADSFNLLLDVSPFPAGDPVVSFDASPVDPAQVALGTVVGRDGAGNECSVAIEIPGSSPIRVTPGALSFGRRQAGGAPASETVVVENVSSRPVEIQSVEVIPAGPFAIADDTGEATLAPGARRTLQVDFQPTREGSFSGTLTVATNAGPSVVSLRGTGLSIGVTTLSESGAGEPVPVTADLPDPFFPQTRLLCYRPGGDASFTCDDLPPPATPLGAKSVVAGTIPATAATERGVEYYLRFEERVEGDVTTLTFPPRTPEETPSQVRVRFDGLAAQGPFSPETYRMISVPASLDDPSVAGVLSDDFGPRDVTAWRLVRWDASTEAYEEIRNPQTPLLPGRSYWLISRTGNAFDVDRGRSTSLQDPVTLTLSPGWHQIASPFAFPVPWSSVDGGDRVEGPFLFDGESGFLPDQETLEPWDGYFILNPGPEPVVLQIPARPEASSVPATARSTSDADARQPDTGGYRLTLSATLPDGRRDLRNVVGTHPAAAEGRDRLDASEPPPVGSHVRLSILDGEHRLSHSFRPIGDAGQRWELEITTSEERTRATSVTLRLSGLDTLPAGHRAYLVDAKAGAALPLSENRARIPLPAGAQPLSLTLIVGTAAFADAASSGAALRPLQTALLPGYPNPLRGGSTTVPYTLAEAGSVQIEIYDLLGRRVRSLVDATRPAGRYTARWDARSDRGRPVANGVYFLRMRAGGQTTVQKVVVLR